MKLEARKKLNYIIKRPNAFILSADRIIVLLNRTLIIHEIDK